MARFDLEREAYSLARSLTALLNGTVCNGPTLSSVYVRERKQAWIGYGISKSLLETEVGIPVCIAGAPNLYLDASYRLVVDVEGEFLMVLSSYIGLFLDAEMSQELCHFDYERGKSDGYPEAHMQMCATSDAWSQLLSDTTPAGEKPRGLDALHFPVGGRRFRPTLEDIIEFLIVERLADPRQGWEQVLNASRDAFREKQLRAAIRRNPEVALQELGIT